MEFFLYLKRKLYNESIEEKRQFKNHNLSDIYYFKSSDIEKTVNQMMISKIKKKLKNS